MITPHIPERFLRYVWLHQRFNAAVLHTSDGRKVEILSPGKPNSDGGPDFCAARIRIGNVTFHGDVELHTDAGEWAAHLHNADEHYNKVILHVVLTADPLSPPARTASKRFLPLLVLHPYLDETLRATWLRAISDERNDRRKSIPCFAQNDTVPQQTVTEWIAHLAHERLELKILRYEERLKELLDEEKMVVREPYPRYYGSPDEIPPPHREYTRREIANKVPWDQLLYEGILEGLGYSKNSESFLLLARSVRIASLRQQGLFSVESVMAVLFGAAGLIPPAKQLTTQQARLYVRALRKGWKSARSSHKSPVLRPGDWQFFRLRPQNFPTARLASFCFLIPALFGEEGFRRLIGLFKDGELSTRDRLHACRRLFEFTPDEFWSHHYHFRKNPSRHGITIGGARVNDLIVNCILPIVMLYARLFKDRTVREHALAMLQVFPPLQDNAVTRVLHSQLLKERRRFATAFEQQGAIQLFKFYCVPARCSSCAIGSQLGLEDRLPATDTFW
jgi:hypothetical protein